MNTSRDTDRTRRRSAVAAVLLGLTFALGACSGSGGGAATQPAGATQGTGATPGTGQATPAATEVAQATSQPGGGGGGGAACDLVTAGEMASALGTGALTSEADPGPPPGCGFRLNGTPVAAVIVTDSGGGPSFDAMAPTSDAVAGVGDKALFNEDAHEFLFMKGGKLVVIVITLPAEQLPGSAADVYKQIASIAAGRA